MASERWLNKSLKVLYTGGLNELDTKGPGRPELQISEFFVRNGVVRRSLDTCGIQVLDSRPGPANSAPPVQATDYAGIGESQSGIG